MVNGDETVSTFILSGEIVEMYENEKSRFAKIKFEPGFIDICIDKISEAHLNDKIIINSSIHINNVVQKLEENNF